MMMRPAAAGKLDARAPVSASPTGAPVRARLPESKEADESSRRPVGVGASASASSAHLGAVVRAGEPDDFRPNSSGACIILGLAQVGGALVSARFLLPIKGPPSQVRERAGGVRIVVARR